MNLDYIAAATCSLNGQSIPCDQLMDSAKGLLGFGIGMFVVMTALFVLMFVFWVMMVVHAVKHPIEHKPLWILVLLLTGILGAVIYYFAVKKQMPQISAVPAGSI
jgi:hypothetical protein